jgi:chromate transporter
VVPSFMTAASEPGMDRPDEAPSLGTLALTFLRISLLGFGGPNAHIALMLDQVVERRRWLSRERFLELVAVTNLLPGPNSSEIAIHVGHTQRGVRGGLVTGLAFVLPTFVIVLGLSALYFRYGTLPATEPVFWALKPLIVAIILAAGWKLARSAMTDGATGTLAAMGAAVAVFAAGAEPLAIGFGAVLGWFLYGRPDSATKNGPARRSALLLLGPLLAPADVVQLGRLLWTTLWIGSVLFGGGYMLVALIEPVVVAQQGWLTQREFLDGIALTQAAPGPIVMLVTFVGFAVAGLQGAAVATLGIYVPSFVAVFVAAPLLARWRARDAVKAVLKGVTAVACGAIIGAGLRLAIPAVPDVAAGALLLAGLVAQLRFGVGPAWIVLAGLMAGVVRGAVQYW